jgi:hypothetical protein
MQSSKLSMHIALLLKGIIILLLSITSTAVTAQQEKIAAILNQQFEKEQLMYDAEDLDKPRLVQRYQVQSDTLSFHIYYGLDYDNDKTRHFNRKVCLCDIHAISKDYNTLFFASEGAVKEQVYNQNKVGEISQQHTNHFSFFNTELRKDPKSDQKLRKALIKAFKKAGHPIYYTDGQEDE